jgi:hypothetical protein
MEFYIRFIDRLYTGLEFFNHGIDITKTALLDGKQSLDGTHCKAMSLARQPNIDLSLAQNAPINDLHLLLSACMSLPPILSHPLHYYKEEVHWVIAVPLLCKSRTSLPILFKPAFDYQTI